MLLTAMNALIDNVIVIVVDFVIKIVIVNILILLHVNTALMDNAKEVDVELNVVNLATVIETLITVPTVLMVCVVEIVTALAF